MICGAHTALAHGMCSSLQGSIRIRAWVVSMWTPEGEFNASLKQGHEPKRSESTISILARAISEKYYSAISKCRSLLI